jgi:hypothetical protein
MVLGLNIEREQRESVALFSASFQLQSDHSAGNESMAISESE